MECTTLQKRRPQFLSALHLLEKVFTNKYFGYFESIFAMNGTCCKVSLGVKCY